MKSRTKHILPFLVLFLLASLRAHAQPTPLEIHHLTGNFYLYTTYKLINGAPFPSNSMYVVTDSGVVMIDTPWDVAQTGPLLDSIERRHHRKVALCVVTHFHDDRTGGLDILKERGVRTYSTEETWRLCGERGERRAEFRFAKDTTFNFGGLSFRTFYPGAGHTHDNIVIWFPSKRVLYGGCFVKSTEAPGLGNLADADVKEWGRSIRKVMRRFPHPAFVIPGHQGWGSARGLEHTLRLLAARKKG